MRCLRSSRYEDSYLSLFIRDAIERDDVFPKLTRRITDCFHLLKYWHSVLYALIGMHMLLAVINMALFYVDFAKDTMFLKILINIRDSILTDEDLKNRFITVGGLNFQCLTIYLSIVLVFNTSVIFGHIIKKKSLVLNSTSRSKCKVLALVIFPVHFLQFEKCALKKKILVLEYEIRDTLKENTLQDKPMAEFVFEKSNEMEELQYKIYHLNKLRCEVEVMNSYYESEPQLVVQLVFIILMKKFPRIELLFTTNLGLPIADIVIIATIPTILSIAKSVYRYHHAKRYPITPNVFGVVANAVGITALVVSKLSLIAVTILNAFYLYPFFSFNHVSLIAMYDKFVSNRRNVKYHEYLAISLAPAFYRSSRLHSENKIIRVFLRLLYKGGPVMNGVFLHFIPLLLYSITGELLRLTMFNYNIDEKYLNKDVTIKSQINSTETRGTQGSTNLLDGNIEIQSHLETMFFIKSLREFPFCYVVVYMVCSIVYMLSMSLYYFFLHPWKIIIRGTTTNELVEQPKENGNEQISQDVDPREQHQNSTDEDDHMNELNELQDEQKTGNDKRSQEAEQKEQSLNSTDEGYDQLSEVNELLDTLQQKVEERLDLFFAFLDGIEDSNE